MANTLRFKRGLVSGIPTAALGEPLFTTDTFDLYIGNGTGNTRFQKYIASGTTSQLLRGDGSLLTMPIVLTSPSNGQVLKYNGTSWVNDSDAGITGSGTTNFLPLFTSASTIGNSILQQGTNAIGIGATTSAWTGSSRALQLLTYTSISTQSNGSANFGFNFYEGGVNSYNYTTSDEANRFSALTTGGFAWFQAAAGTAGNTITFTQAMTLFPTNNLVIGSVSDNGLRFQVTGDGYFSGSVGVGSASLTGVSLRVAKNVTGSVNTISVYNDGVIQSDSTSSSIGYYNILRTQAASFNINYAYHFLAVQATLGAGSTIANQYGFVADSSLTSATNNYGFYGNIASGTGRWNLYMNGSAANYLAGDVGIGTTTPSTKLSVIGGITSSAFTRVNLNGSDSIGAGAFTALYNTAFTTAVLQQLNASNGLDWWSLASSTWTKRMTLTADGNLGLGVTPSAWYLGNGFEIGQYTQIHNNFSAGSASFISNAYYLNPGTWYYKATWGASRYTQVNGVHQWFNAPSGTAGNAITFTQAMTLHSTGNLAIGTGAGADAGFRLDVNGTMRVSGASTFNNFITVTRNQDANVTTFNATAGVTPVSAFVINTDQPNLRAVLTSRNGYSLALGTNDTNRLTIDTTGAATFSSSVTVGGNLTVDTNTLFVDAANNRVGVGTSSPTAKFDVFGTGLQLGSTSYYYNTRIINNNNSGLLLGGDNSTSVGLIAGINEIAFVTYGGAGWTEKVRLSGDGNLGIANLTPSYKLDVTGEARVSNAIAIGTTPDTNKPFKVLKNINGTVGINFENTSTGSLAFSAIQMGTDVTGGTKFTNIVYSSSGVAQSGVYYPDGTSIINIGTGGLNFYSQGAPIRMFNGGGNGVLKWEMVNDSFINHYTGTAPTTSATDGYRQYSADVVAGNAAPHFRTENGAVIKLYQETTGVGNAIFSQGGGNSVLDDSTFDGYTLRQIVKALRNQGILA